MTLQQLLYAIETDKLGSLNKAAQSLYVTRQSLTCAINELESELGIKIFERTNKGLQTTTEGYEFIKMAKSVTAAYEDLQRAYSDKGNKKMRFNLVSVPNYFVENAFVKLCTMNDHSSSLTATLKSTDPYKALDDVFSSQAEIATVMISEAHKNTWVNALYSKGLEYFKLMDAQVTVLIGANDPLAQSPVISPRQLEDYSFVFWAGSSKNILNLLPETSEFAKRIVKNNRFINAQYHSTLFMIIEKTKAFALNYSGMNEHFGVYPVVNLLLDEKINFELLCVKQKGRPPSREADLFIKLLQENIKERQQFERSKTSGGNRKRVSSSGGF